MITSTFTHSHNVYAQIDLIDKYDQNHSNPTNKNIPSVEPMAFWNQNNDNEEEGV